MNFGGFIVCISLYLLFGLKCGKGQVGSCDYYFLLEPQAEYTPQCDPVGRKTFVACMLLMYELPTNVTRPTIEFYWSPDISTVDGTWVDIAASPTKYNSIDVYHPSSNLVGLSPELAGIVGYERKLEVLNTGTPDFGYYWCILEHPAGSPNANLYSFSRSQDIHIYKPVGVSTLCLEDPMDPSHYTILFPPECCETEPPTTTPTTTTTTTQSGTTISNTNSTWHPLCCTREQAIIISSGLSIGFVVCVVIVVLLFSVNYCLIKMEERAQKAAKLRADWRALGVTNELEHHQAGLYRCGKCIRDRQYRIW